MSLASHVRERVLPPLLVALLLLFLQVRSGTAESYALVAAATAALAYVMSASGRLLLLASGAGEPSPAGAYALGLLGTCLALYALTIALPLTAGMAFGAVAIPVAALDLAAARRQRVQEQGWRAFIGFALCIALTAAWCVGQAGAYEVLRNQGVLPVWGDHFIHAARISQFGDALALGRGSIFLADYPSSFYHFAPYLSAAPLAGMLDQPGLALATSAWVPLGFLAMTAGAYTLGERLAGTAGGVAAIAAVAILPDASNYALRNGFLSFHWSLFAHPGAMYALGAAFFSLALLERWSAGSSGKVLLASGALAASMLFFRAHVFLLYLPAWMATVAYCGLRLKGVPGRIGPLLAAALAAAAGGASLLLTHLAQADPSGQWRFRGPALVKFLEALHLGHEPTAYTGLYPQLVSWYPWWFSLSAGVLLAFIAALGAFTVLLPAAAVLARRCRKMRAIDVFPGFAVYCWLLLMLLAPATWALEGPELIDRPVVLVYACAAIWTLALPLRCLAARARWSEWTWRALLAGCLAALPATLAGADAMVRPKFASGAAHMALRVEPGLVATAAFLRQQARPGDTFAVGGLSAEFAVVDLAAQVCALSGVPAYLARPHLEMIKDGPRKNVAAVRLAALQDIDAQSDYAEAAVRLGRIGVQWYIVAGAQGPTWDPGRERADFSRGHVSLYAVPRRP